MSPDDLSKILDELGQRLGPAGGHVFELAVRQAIIDGVMSLVGGVVYLAAFLVGVVLAVRITRRPASSDRDDFVTREMAPVLFLLVGGIGALVAAVCALGGLSTLLNPEYAAIRDLLEHLKL